MNHETKTIAEFVEANREQLAGYFRKKMIAAGGKNYVDQLGKVGTDALNCESAGVLLDLACALLSRLNSKEYDAQLLLDSLPPGLQKKIQLPRSKAYHEIMDELKKQQSQKDSQ